jgi:hypothetical protein
VLVFATNLGLGSWTTHFYGAWDIDFGSTDPIETWKIFRRYVESRMLNYDSSCSTPYLGSCARRA